MSFACTLLQLRVEAAGSPLSFKTPEGLVQIISLRVEAGAATGSLSSEDSRDGSFFVFHVHNTDTEYMLPGQLDVCPLDHSLVI